MKKLPILLIVLLLILCIGMFVACGEKTTSNGNSKGSQEQGNNVQYVSILIQK